MENYRNSKHKLTSVPAIYTTSGCSQGFLNKQIVVPHSSSQRFHIPFWEISQSLAFHLRQLECERACRSNLFRKLGRVALANKNVEITSTFLFLHDPTNPFCRAVIQICVCTPFSPACGIQVSSGTYTCRGVQTSAALGSQLNTVTNHALFCCCVASVSNSELSPLEVQALVSDLTRSRICVSMPASKMVYVVSIKLLQ